MDRRDRHRRRRLSRRDGVVRATGRRRARHHGDPHGADVPRVAVRKVPALRTEITEIVTALGMLGFVDVDAALTHLPPEMQHVPDEVWRRVRDAARDGTHRQEFAAAFANGAAFLSAREALRGRRPLMIEWRGPKRAPGDEVVPADLRIDHVYLVSCKYLSRILVNASPHHLFDRLLAGGHGRRGGDWFGEVAPGEHATLYAAVRSAFASDADLPPTPDAL